MTRVWLVAILAKGACPGLMTPLELVAMDPGSSLDKIKKACPERPKGVEWAPSEWHVWSWTTENRNLKTDNRQPTTDNQT